MACQPNAFCAGTCIAANRRFSPVYDLNPNIEKSDFATAIDDTGAKSTIELALKTAADFRLSDKRAGEILEQIKDAVSTWQKLAKSFGIPEHSIKTMKPAFLQNQPSVQGV